MFVKRRIMIVLALAGLSANALAQSPAGYPADYAKVVEAAKKEGKVVVYSTTDSKAAEALIRDFSMLYPAVKVEYNDMNSTEVITVSSPKPLPAALPPTSCGRRRWTCK